MKITKLMIDTAKLASQVAGVSAPALDPTDCRRLPIVEVLPSGRVDIIDGFHRISGMIAWGATTIDCIMCDDSDLLADAANPEDSIKQAAAIDAIYGA